MRLCGEGEVEGMGGGMKEGLGDAKVSFESLERGRKAAEALTMDVCDTVEDGAGGRWFASAPANRRLGAETNLHGWRTTEERPTCTL